jgi:hypothetical protein
MIILYTKLTTDKSVCFISKIELLTSIIDINAHSEQILISMPCSSNKAKSLASEFESVTK